MSLDGSDSYCLGAFGSLLDLELDTLVLREGAVAASLDLGIVDEEILRAAIGGDEVEARVTVEPFHSSLCIYLLPSFNAHIPKTSTQIGWHELNSFAGNRCGAMVISAMHDFDVFQHRFCGVGREIRVVSEHHGGEIVGGQNRSP
jgi:hypothetical protein